MFLIQLSFTMYLKQFLYPVGGLKFSVREFCFLWISSMVECNLVRILGDWKLYITWYFVTTTFMNLDNSDNCYVVFHVVRMRCYLLHCCVHLDGLHFGGLIKTIRWLNKSFSLNLGMLIQHLRQNLLFQNHS